MGFLWSNGIQGEPGYSPGGLPGGLSWSWLTNTPTKNTGKKKGKQLCVLENQPFQLFIYVFFSGAATFREDKRWNASFCLRGCWFWTWNSTVHHGVKFDVSIGSDHSWLKYNIGVGCYKICSWFAIICKVMWNSFVWFVLCKWLNSWHSGKSTSSSGL